MTQEERERRRATKLVRRTEPKRKLRPKLTVQKVRRRLTIRS